MLWRYLFYFLIVGVNGRGVVVVLVKVNIGLESGRFFLRIVSGGRSRFLGLVFYI